MSNGTNITNTYDADGRRVQKVVGTQTTKYLWDETSLYGDVVYETTGSVSASYVLAGSKLISQTQNGVESYYLQDGLGSTRNLTDSTGNVTDSYSYTAFGEIYNQTGTTENKYLYTGQQYDAETNLYSLRARYYNPSSGRFLSQDTYAVNFNNPIELNRYGYAAGNPVNRIDPSGYTASKEYGLITATLLGALMGGGSNAAMQLYVNGGYNDKFNWGQLLGATIAGAVAGTIGAIVGTVGASMWGTGFLATVGIGAFDGWLSGLVSRGITNWSMGGGFFDGYSWWAAATDAMIGGFMAVLRGWKSLESD